MRIPHTRNVNIPKYYVKELNKFFNTGYFIRIPVCNDFVWGVSSFYSQDNLIRVEELQGMFLGGGIHQIYGYKVTIGSNNFYCRKLHYALRCIYTYLVKTGKIQTIDKR